MAVDQSSKASTAVRGPTNPEDERKKLEAAKLNNSPLIFVPAPLRGQFVEALNRIYGTNYSGPDDPLLANSPVLRSQSAIDYVLGQVSFGDSYTGKPKARTLDRADQASVQADEQAGKTVLPAQIPTPSVHQAQAFMDKNPASQPYMAQVVRMAQKYGVPWQLVWGVIDHESAHSWQADIVGDYGNSHGLAQIYGPAHPDVTVDQANDPSFAIEFVARSMAEHYGQFHDWNLAVLAHNSPGAAEYLAEHKGLVHAPGRNGVDQKYLAGVLTSIGEANAGGLLDPNMAGGSGGGGGGIKSPYDTPDPGDLSRTLTDNFKAMFFRDPTPAEVASLMGVVQTTFARANQAAASAAVNAAPSPYGYDPVSAARAAGHPDPDAVLAGNQTPGGAAVAAALRYKGTPYGGTDPTKGLDCSALVQRAFHDVGIDLPRTSQQQATAGVEVGNLAAAVPGDLIVFSPPGGEKNGHIGIYIGNGQMIDAPHTGAQVSIRQVPTSAISTIRRVAGDMTSAGVPGGIPMSAAASTTQNAAPSADGAAEDALRSTPEYQQLYGAKPAGQTDQAYAGGFSTVGGNVLGTGPVPDAAVRAGMAEGNPATTYGYLTHASSSEANPSFRERMFKMAQYINGLV